MDKARPKSLSPAELQHSLQNEGRLFYLDGKSPISNHSSSTEEGGAGSSSSFDNSSAGSTYSSDLHGMPQRKSFTRTNHSEIEKRRRRKINKFIDELSDLVPICNASSRKPDKITVLKMAVQYVRILCHREEQRTFLSERFKPASLSEEEMASLLEDASGGFLFVASTDRFQILHVSETIQKYLPLSPLDLLGKRLIDIVHPNDVTLLREQLTPAQTSKASLPSRYVYNPIESSTRSSGTFVTSCRRAFFCRLKNQCQPDQDMDVEMSATGKALPFQASLDDTLDYSLIHCVGFIKTWQPADAPLFTVDNELDLSTSSCFFAVGRKINVLSERSDIQAEELNQDQCQFTCRCAADGRYLHVDPKMVHIFGHLPQELLSKKFYNFIAMEDRQKIKAFVEEVLSRKTSDLAITDKYRIVARNGAQIPVVTALFCFYNPVTKDLEYIVLQSSIALEIGSMNTSNASFEVFSSNEVAP